MPASAKSSPRLRGVDAEYSYRRPLRARELLPAIAIGVGAGLFAFYVTRLLLQRTPLRVARGSARDEARTGERSRRP